MQVQKILYWVFTALMCGLFLFSAFMYFTKTEMVRGFFTELGFPTWVVIPLAVTKILGIIAVLTNKVKVLVEWAYAGFFFDAVLATGAHYFAGHGLFGMSFFGIFLVLGSRFFHEYRVSGVKGDLL